MHKKLFVWDFHGVLEKGNDNAVLEVSNKALEKLGFEEKFTKKDAEKLSGLKWYEYFSYLLPKKDLSVHLDLQKKCFEIAHLNLDLVKKHVFLNDGAKEVLNKIKNSPHHQILISNTKQKSLENYLNIVGIEEFFPKGNFFGVDSHTKRENSKAQVLKNYLKSNFFNQIICIGDSPSDIKLAKLHENSVSYLYTHPNKSHRKVKANYKIKDLKYILKELI